MKNRKFQKRLLKTIIWKVFTENVIIFKTANANYVPEFNFPLFSPHPE